MREAILAAMVLVLLTGFWTVTAIAPYGTRQPPQPSQSYNDVAAIMEAVRGREFIASVNPYLDRQDVDKLLAEFLRASREYRIDLDLLLSVAAAESHFRADVVSHKGCVGIMQVKPSTAIILGVDPAELTNPATNINTGARYLRVLLDRYDDVSLTIAAYNAGPSRVRTTVPQIWETKAYVARVSGHREVLRR